MVVLGEPTIFSGGTWCKKVENYCTRAVVPNLGVILITLSYVGISIALGRIASGEERLKASKTCTSHLILVAIFFLPIIGTNIASVVSYINPNARMINTSLTNTMPPLLNPIVYSLKTEEILIAIKKLVKRNKISFSAKKRLKS